MGVYARVYIEDGVELPHFPRNIDRESMVWQSKSGLDAHSGPYRITYQGRLERKQKSHRKKTEEEKQAEAEKWGFSCWEEYVEAYNNIESGLIPSEIDYDRESDKDSPPTISPSENTVDEVWWADHNMHGTFEFHQSIKKDPIEYEEVVGPNGKKARKPSEYELDVYIEYEARFTRGDLDEIVFMGERMSNNPVEETVSKLREWDRDNL